MDSDFLPQDEFDENQSIRVIQQMIQVAQQRHAQDGVLFIVWGWLLMVSNTVFALGPQIFVTTTPIRNILNYVYMFLWFGAILFTLIYLIKRYSRVRTHTGITLLFVWIGLIAFLMVSNVIHTHFLNQILEKVGTPFEYLPMALSPMLLVAFAIFVTGLILRYWLVMAGAVLFGVFVLISTYISYEWQLVLSALGWTVAFIIPGHVIYARRNKHA